MEQLKIDVEASRAWHCEACGVLTSRHPLQCDCTQDRRKGMWTPFTIDDLIDAISADNVHPEL